MYEDRASPKPIPVILVEAVYVSVPASQTTALSRVRYWLLLLYFATLARGCWDQLLLWIRARYRTTGGGW